MLMSVRNWCLCSYYLVGKLYSFLSCFISLELYLLCYVRCATLLVWVGGECLGPKQGHNSVSCTVRTSRQGSCNQRVLVVFHNLDLEPLVDLLNGLALGWYQPAVPWGINRIFLKPKTDPWLLQTNLKIVKTNVPAVYYIFLNRETK